MVKVMEGMEMRMGMVRVELERKGIRPKDQVELDLISDLIRLVMSNIA